MTQVKLKKLIIHKICQFKHVSLDFGVSTSIAGNATSAVALPSLVHVIKFLCNCSDIHEKDLEFEASRSEPDDGSPSYVEGQIVFPDGSQRKFRRTLDQRQSVFSVEGEDVTEEVYQKELEASGILPAEPSATFVISQANVRTAANFTDRKRSEFIDSISIDEEVRRSYAALDKKLENLRVECDAARKSKAELTAAKKKLKGQIDEDKSRVQLNSEIENQETQLALFTLFHNEALIDSMDEEIAHLKTQSTEARERALVDHDIPKLTKTMQKLTKDSSLLMQRVGKYKAGLEFTQHSYFQLLSAETKRQDEEKEEDLRREIRETRVKVLDREIELLEDELRLRAEGSRAEHDLQVTALKGTYNNKAKVEEVAELQKKIDSKYRDIPSAKIEAQLQEFEIDEVTRERLRTLKDELKENQEKIDKFEQKQQQQLGVLVTEHSRVASKLHEFKKQRQKDVDSQSVFLALRQHFRECIVGRMSSLWNAVSPGAKLLWEERLGKLRNAIVVDTKETAEACVEFLMTKQLISVEEILFPLSDFANLKSTKSLLPRGRLPTGVDCIFFHNLVETQSEVIEKLLIRCVKPSLVTDSIENEEKLVQLKSTKKVNIIGQQSRTTYDTRGTLSRGAKPEEDELDNLEDVRAKEHELEVKKLYLQQEVYQDGELIKHLKQRNRLLSALLETRATEETAAWESDPDVIKYKRLRRELDDHINKHFEEFMIKINCPSVKEYDRLREFEDEEINEWIKMKTEQRNANLNASRVEGRKTPSPEFEKATNAKKQTEAAFEKTFEHLRSYSKQLFKISQDIRVRQAERGQKIEEFLKENEKIYNQLNNEQKALKENYEILCKNFTESRSTDLVDESLELFAVVPGAVTDDYQVVEEQLNRVHVAFDKLKNSLKHEIDFAAKAREMQTRLEKLRSKLEDFKKKRRDEGNERRLATISTELSKISKELDAKMSKLDEIGAQFQTIKESRARSFKDSIEVINESLVEFCNSAFDSQVVPSLECTNDNEPYLHDVAFYWRTIDNPDGQVNEMNLSFDAALALLIGVTKLNKQSFVVLSNATDGVDCNFLKFFDDQKSLQVVLLASKLSDDRINYVIRGTRSSFAFTRIN